MAIRGLHFLKRIRPQTLFGRTLLIVLMPLLLVQLISAYIFFERHWDSVTRRLAHVTAGQISALIEMREKLNPSFEILSHISHDDFNILVTKRSHDTKLKSRDHGQFNVHRFRRESILRTVFKRDFWEIFLIEALQKQLTYPFHVNVLRHSIIIEVATAEGIYEFQTPRRQVFTGTTLIFMMWSVGTTILFMLISIIFLRNQIRPIRNLAEAAEKFGKGQVFVPFKPSGAIEVKKAAIAFIMMRERIARQIKQRTEMLAGVSHDLRTPLTRIKLQLAMLPQSAECAALGQDVDEMEGMIDAYLSFARGEGPENTKTIDLLELMENLATKLLNNTKKVHWPEPIIATTIQCQPAAMRRALTNIIQNADKFATEIWISWHQTEQHTDIVISDNGLGVPPMHYENIFKPFYRLESSRNRNTGGAGLGLAIARNIVRSHGGDITAKASEHGGLELRIRLLR